MINSILHRHTDPVAFHNIILPNEIITKPQEIKKEIKNYYENWTKLNSPNILCWQLQKEEYNPVPNIIPDQLDILTIPITLKELIDTIHLAPLHKATSLQNISNEMLKHLNDLPLQLLLKIVNVCLQLQIILKIQKQSNIFLISKKPIFTGQLNCTRPITLIEHTRKILTKIITI